MGTDNPYVGARPFTAAQCVFGRDRERREIVDLVIAERIVLLHAPSGAGKTSLLQGRGGVADTLRDEGFAVLPIARVGLPPSTPPLENRYLDSVLASLGLEPSGDEALAGLAAREPDAVGVVLIVDQFEEILTVDPTGEADRVTFFRALGRALENRRLWAILALREEYLGALAPYRGAIPTRLRTMYRLDLLGPEAAREAIVCPARAAGVPFTDVAAEKLVQELCTVTVPRPDGTAERKLGTNVEPVELQVVCHRLWLRRGPDVKEIAEGEIDTVESVDAALVDYYAAAVAEASRRSSASERRIRAWIEQALITKGGVRSQVMRYGEGDNSVPDETVRALVDAYILRQDTRRDVDWIELAHDRLVRPIVKDNTAWRREHLNVMQTQAALWKEREHGEDLCLRGVGLVEAERWAASHEGQLTPIEKQFLAASRKTRDKDLAARVRQRLWLSIAVAVAVFMGALGFWAWSQKLEADRARKAGHEAILTAGARECLAHDQPAVAMKLLLAMDSGQHPDWVDLANEALNEGGLRVTLRGDAGYVPLAAFSPNGAKILAAAWDSTMRVWNADGSGMPVTLFGHKAPVTAAAFSPDGTRIVTASGDWTVRVWNADGSGEPIVLRGFKGSIYSAVFSPDGTRIAASSDDRTARVWRADGSGEPVVLRGHEGGVGSAAFSADGRKVVTASSDKTARVWNADGLGEPVVLKGHTEQILSAEFSADGTRVVTGSWDKTARVWNADGSGEPVVLKGHDNLVYAAAFSHDGAKIATASQDWTARVWNANGSGEPLVLRGHNASVHVAAFSPDGRRVVTASNDGTARVWNVDASEEPIVLRGHEAQVKVAAFSRDGTKIVTASDDKTVRVWDAHGSGEPVTDIHRTVGDSGVFSPDFKRMVRTDWNGTTRVLTIDGSSKPIVLEEHDGMTSAFSPDGKKIVTASDDHTARVWNADGAGEPVVLRGHEDVVATAAFSPDGTKIVTASWDHTARVWNADGSGKPLVLRGHEGRVRRAVFSPDGRRILTGSDDATARVWNADGHGEPVVLRGHADLVRAVAFSLDGRRIATGSHDNTARVWSVDGTGNPVVLTVLTGHHGPILGVAFSSDGKLVATGSDDHTARVWPADGTGRAVALSGHTTSVEVVAFDPSNQRVITVSAEDNLKIWNLSVKALEDELASANADCLLPDQRTLYLDETGAQTRDHYAACERQHGRVPSDHESP